MDIDDDAGPGDDDGGVSECEVPSTWDGSDFDTNAAVQLALRGRLQALNTRMTMAEYETPTATDLDDLEMLFQDGDPSLEDAITQTYADVTADIFALFVDAVGNELDPSTVWDPTPESSDQGGRLCGPSPTDMSGCWIISTGGVDLRQIFEKGAFQAVLYHQAHALATGNVTPATIDQIAALFGANSALDINGTNVHASNYAKGMGFYGTIRGHLIAAKAYAEGGAACETELQGELDAILANWEQSQMARVVYYANRASDVFSSTSPSEAQMAEALHWFGEGLGLVYGFKGLPAGSKIISDADIDEILTLMKMPAIDMAALYEFREGELSDLNDIEAAFDVIQDVYDFSNDQMDQFRTPTPG